MWSAEWIAVWADHFRLHYLQWWGERGRDEVCLQTNLWTLTFSINPSISLYLIYLLSLSGLSKSDHTSRSYFIFCRAITLFVSSELNTLFYMDTKVFCLKNINILIKPIVRKKTLPRLLCISLILPFVDVHWWGKWRLQRQGVKYSFELAWVKNYCLYHKTIDPVVLSS